MDISLKQIAHIENAYKTKFGIPRQSGLANETESRIVFEPEYKNPDAIRGIEGFSYIWVLWIFTESITDEFKPTVRPPRLGGNTKVGVFASRSPFRPNPIGLSCVKLLRVENGDLIVAGSDIMNGTPIIDIKPYILYADMKADAMSGYAKEKIEKLNVQFFCEVPEGLETKLKEILELDPRPHYQNIGEREYGILYDKYDVRFKVENGTLTVFEIKLVEDKNDIT